MVDSNDDERQRVTEAAPQIVIAENQHSDDLVSLGTLMDERAREAGRRRDSDLNADG